MTSAIAYQLRDDLYRRPLVTALERLGDTEGMTSVDVGAGGGDVTVALAEISGETGRVYAVDIDPIRRNEIAKRAANYSQVVALTQSVEELTLPEKVDLAFARFLLLNVYDPSKAIKRMISVIKPGGWLVLQEAITSYGRVGTTPLKLDTDQVIDQDIGLRLLDLLPTNEIVVRDCWMESPIGKGNNEISTYLEAMTDVRTDEETIVLPPIVTVVARRKG
ncbi:MAG: methyltransferase domain-containing protein [Actinomycetota bacterium]|nr:methyltransferase domain-containing protein [Actinomycetota bacterium]